MRIAFDHQAFCRQIAGGISRYYCRLTEELSHLDQEVGIFAPIYRNIYLKELDHKFVHGYGVKNYPSKTANAFVAANALIAKPMIQQWKPDIVHETYFDKKSPHSNQCPSVITVFDMIGELDALNRFNQQLDFKKTDKYLAINRADHVICISEHTRQDLARLFNVSPNKMTVIHLGCDIPSSQLSNPSTPSMVKKPFLLYVGMREGYKNFDQMLKAISSSRQLMSTFDIVAFGGGKFTPAEQQQVSKLGFSAQQVRQITGDDQDLNLLYESAIALIYPSKYEGFGLPPLEAMAHQCPVVSSNTSSMPEVIGDAAEYFDPINVESIRTAIENVVFSEARLDDLIRKGSKRVTQFAWSTCAEKTLHVYETLVHKS